MMDGMIGQILPVEGLPPTIGVVGLGVMGRPMTANLLAAAGPATRVFVHHRSADRVAELTDAGTIFVATPRELASAARAGSQAHTKRTIPIIMDVNPEAVIRAFRATGARRLIHGHTHRPAVHPIVFDGISAERVVLAPWYEAASCVAVDAEGVREIPLPR